MNNMIRTIYRSNDPHYNISKHFAIEEHMCKCGKCEEQLLHPNLYPMLEKLRARCGGRGIKITSGYRCPAHNEKVGGAPKSKHMEGIAADIKVKGMKASELGRLAVKVGFTGVKTYRHWVHVDIRPWPVWHDL